MNPLLANIKLSTEIYNKLSKISDVGVDVNFSSLETTINNLASKFKLIPYYRDTNSYKTMTVDESTYGKIIDIAPYICEEKKHYIRITNKDTTNFIIHVDENGDIIKNRKETSSPYEPYEHLIIINEFIVVQTPTRIICCDITFDDSFIKAMTIPKTVDKEIVFTNVYYDEMDDVLFILGYNFKDNNIPFIYRIPYEMLNPKNHIEDMDAYKMSYKPLLSETNIPFKPYAMASGKEGYVMVGESDSFISIASSPNGTQWFEVDMGCGFEGCLYSVVYNKGVFAAVGYGGETSYCMFSFDTVHWENSNICDGCNTSFIYKFDNITSCGNMFLISSRDSNVIYYTYDLQYIRQYEINPKIENIFNDFNKDLVLTNPYIKVINDEIVILNNYSYTNTSSATTQGQLISISKSSLMFIRDSISDDSLLSSNGPGTVIISRTPYRNPSLYLGFGFWVLCERCDGICEYTRVI